MEAPSLDASNALAESNLRLAYFLTGRLSRSLIRLHGGFDDAAQVAAIALIRASRDFKPELGFKFSTFAGTCITNALQNPLRGRSVRSIALPEHFDAAAPMPPDPHAHDQLHQALDRLREREREIVRRHFFDGLTFEAIGLALGISGGRAQQILERALCDLADELWNEGT